MVHWHRPWSWALEHVQMRMRNYWNKLITVKVPTSTPISDFDSRLQFERCAGDRSNVATASTGCLIYASDLGLAHSKVVVSGILLWLCGFRSCCLLPAATVVVQRAAWSKCEMTCCCLMAEYKLLDACDPNHKAFPLFPSLFDSVWVCLFFSFFLCPALIKLFSFASQEVQWLALCSR